MRRSVVLAVCLAIFTSIGRGDEMNPHAVAAAQFEAKLKANPLDVDAAFNAGQAYYNLGKMDLALDRWQKAHKLAPTDFDIAKKILQATYGAGRDADIPAAHAQVLALWQSSGDPRVKGLKEFVFDQFHVGGMLVMANETLSPRGNLYDVYNFKFYDAANKLVGIVHLESSQYGRETGVPLVVAVSTPAGHRTKNIMFKSMPPYAELKRVVTNVAATDLNINPQKHGGIMSIMGDRFEGTFEGHKIELVRTNLDKQVAILVDGNKIAEESVALPHQWDRTVEFELGGVKHSLAAHSALKKLFGAIPYDNTYAIEIDGRALALIKTK